MDDTKTCNGNVDSNLEVNSLHSENDKLDTKPNGDAVHKNTAGENESSSISNSQSDINSLPTKEQEANSKSSTENIGGCDYNTSVDSDCESESDACNKSKNVRVVSADVHKENEITYNGGIDSSNTSDSSNDESSTIVYNVHIDEKTEDICLNCRHRIVSNKNSCKKQKKRNVNTLVHRHTL